MIVNRHKMNAIQEKNSKTLIWLRKIVLRCNMRATAGRGYPVLSPHARGLKMRRKSVLDLTHIAAAKAASSTSS